MTSPYAVSTDGLRTKEGAPPISRPTKEQIAAFPDEASKLLDDTWSDQRDRLDGGDYDISWMHGKHIVVVGGTGRGLGGAAVSTALNNLGRIGSLVVVGRDMTRSLEFETGQAMVKRAEEHAGKFMWMNDGIAVEGEPFDKIVSFLQSVGAEEVIYINGVAAASSGLLPEMPPVFAKDVDEEGLFQWLLMPLPPRAIEATRLFMGTLTVEFPRALEKAGFKIACAAFADWRGSLDIASRMPESPVYGRWGGYSTSLYLPKDIIQKAVAEAYANGEPWIDVFFPTMRTRALPFIPGGVTASYLYEKLMALSGVRRLDIPELGLCWLDQIGKRLSGEDMNPFPRHDAHEEPLDLWSFEITKNMNDDPSSAFYYRKWVDYEPDCS